MLIARFTKLKHCGVDATFTQTQFVPKTAQSDSRNHRNRRSLFGSYGFVCIVRI